MRAGTARKIRAVAKSLIEFKDELVTIAEASDYLGCSRSTVRRLRLQGKLEQVRFGGRPRITVRSLNALVREMLNPAPPS